MHDISDVFHSADLPKKQFWLGIVFMAYSAAFWVFVRWLFGVLALTATTTTVLLISSFVWALLLSFVMVFVQKRWAYLIYGVLLLQLLLLFGFVGSTFLGIILFAFVIWLAHIRGERIKKILADFSAWFISRKALSLFFTGLAIFLSFAFTNFILAQNNYNLKISPQVHHVMFAPVDLFLDISIPGYERGMTVGEFQDILLNTFLQNFAPEQSGQVPPGTSSQFFDTALTEQTLEEFTLNWLNTTIETSLAPYQDILPLIYTIGLFSVFRLLLWPLMWLTIGAFILAIKLLLLYNILDKKEIEIVKEIPVLE